MRRRLAALDALYDRAATAPVRVETGYTHYLPCVLLMADQPAVDLAAALHARSEGAVLRTAASGVLYVGPKGVLLCIAPPRADTGGAGRWAVGALRPPRRPSILSSVRPPRPRFEAPSCVVELGPVRQVTAVSVALPQGHFARLARIRPRYAMLLRWPTGQALLAIPAIGDTLPKLHRCLDDLRWAS